MNEQSGTPEGSPTLLSIPLEN